HISGKSQSGTIQISGNVANMDLNSLSGTGMVRLTFSNFISGAYAVNSGTADISLSSTGGITLVTNLQTSEGLINLSLRLTEGMLNAQVMNTLSPGSAGQFRLNIQNVTFDDDICEKYPSSGTITFTKNGTTGVVTFTGACDGSYLYSEQ
ncbi:MAG: hypothetical protein P8Y00_12825, partial [Deltaproteobacteria bacterium]